MKPSNDGQQPAPDDSLLHTDDASRARYFEAVLEDLARLLGPRADEPERAAE